MKNRVRWRVGVLSGAAALLCSLASLDAHALALGRLTVQSALGEPLRAEIDITEISADESSSLRTSVASPDAFKTSGLEYSPAISGLQITLLKRPDGRSYLRLSSSRPVAEPFVDLILEANWSSGRVVRDYTMLFDPPSLRQAGSAGANVVPTAPIFSRPAPVAPSPASGLNSIPYPPPATVLAPLPRPAPVARTPVERPRPAAPATASERQVSVKTGDTAGRIAAANKPASVSLDQMLVALLRSNPEAFIGGNINRVKSGAVLNIPGSDEASAISPGEATRTIVAQSQDFNNFRRKLAEGVPATQTTSANRQAGGKVQAKVEDRAPAAAVPDKLTLSKGAVQGKATEDRIAKERQASDAAARVAELTKNIGDLNKLTGASAAPAAAASAARAPGIAVTTPPIAAALPASAAAVAASAPAAAASAPATAASVPLSAASAVDTAATAAANAASATASVPASIASEPEAAASAVPAPAPVVKKAVAPPPPPPPEPSLVDELMENPFVIPGIAALLLLIAGLGFYRFKKKRSNAAQVDSSFLESRLQPDSFFGASGGQRIDTNEGGATGSSLVYSPSQLDAAGDVDPVAEADVYLAYGRDLQAEEILKEAMRTTPGRVAIHSKLMEIYAKRRDAKAFEVIAVEAYNMTRGEGPEWAYIGEMGRELDASNPLYQPGGQPLANNLQAGDSDYANSGAGFGSSTIPQQLQPVLEEPSAPVDFDLDLDFSLADEPEPVVSSAPAPPVVKAPVYEPEPTVAMKAAADPIFEGLEMDFSTDTVALKPTSETPSASSFDLDASDALSASGLSFTAEDPPAKSPVSAQAPAAIDSGMLEFDLGSLSLDLPDSDSSAPAASPVASSGTSDDPLETKFALAEEFRALGDSDGARALAEEVAAQATGSLKAKAQNFLNALS